MFSRFILPAISLLFLSCGHSLEPPAIVDIEPPEGTEITVGSTITIEFSQPVFPIKDNYGTALFYNYNGPVEVLYNYDSFAATYSYMVSNYDIKTNILSLTFSDANLTPPSKIGLEIDHTKIVNRKGLLLDISGKSNESKLILRYTLK